jgi:cyclic nucleotide gated channel
MDFKNGIKLVRFNSDGKNHKQQRQQPPSSSSSMLKPNSSNVTPLGKTRISRSKVFSEDHEPWRKRILDPGSEIVLKWNRIFIVSCLVALFVDPLYFYLPSVVQNTNSSCVRTDFTLRIVVTFLRTIADVFYLLHLIIKFRTAYVAPSSRVFGRGELVMDPSKIARRYIRSDFFIDFIATLPLPQVCCLFFTLTSFYLVLSVSMSTSTY